MENKKLLKWKIVSIVLAAAILIVAIGSGYSIVKLKEKTDILAEITAVQKDDIVKLGEALDVALEESGSVNVSWRGKKWCSYGDSITQLKSWQDYITEYFGFARHYERGIGSATITKSEQTWWANPDGSYNSRYGFESTEQPAGTTEHEGYFCSTDRINTMIPEDTDLVVVMGGTNDADLSLNIPLGDLSYPYDETTFKGAVASMIVKIQQRVPNAVIVLCSPLSGRGPEDETLMHGNTTEPQYNGIGLTTQDYAEAMEEVCEYLSIPYIDVFGETGINCFNRAQYISDTVHPNDEGGKAIARVIIGRLETLKPVERK